MWKSQFIEIGDVWFNGKVISLTCGETKPSGNSSYSISCMSVFQGIPNCQGRNPWHNRKHNMNDC